MNDIYGQCACGTIKYKFTTDRLFAYQCHCPLCRKVSGTAYTTTLMAPAKGFTWLGDEVAITSHISNTGYKSAYCPDCGSPVPNKFRDHPLYSVPVGSMDSSTRWDKEPLQGEKFKEMPELATIFKLLHI